MRFHPFHTLGSKKNIIVDGAAQENSVLVLSHWPASPTPDAWLRDTSAEIVLDYLETEDIPSGVEYVSNNHFDEDGLLGISALIDPEFARTHRDGIIDAATAGDFGRYRERDSARVNFTITKLVSEVPEYADFNKRTARTYEALLPMVPRLIDNIDQFENAWCDEDRFLTECERWIDQGLVTIEEHEKYDLAIVTISADISVRHPNKFASETEGPLHKMSVYNRTNRARVLFQHGPQYWFRYRYESWVKFVTERHPFRVDLTPLCSELNKLEQEGARWVYDGSSNITPVMRTVDAMSSSLDLDTLLDRLCKRLDEGDVDWNPYEATDSGHG
ncbi:MAG: DUF6687 family protein [Hyphomicrobiaceae bacterium]